MNKSAHMTILAAVATMGLVQAAAAQGPDEPFLRPYGMFEVDQGQTKTLAFGKHDRTYRICVTKAPHTVPLKVMTDGRDSMVYPGDCTDVEGQRIEIAPGGKLGPDMTLIGRYHHIDERPAS